MKPKEEYYKIVAKQVIKNLNKRNIDGYYCLTKEEAKEKIFELIEKEATVSWGGSMTLKELNLFEKIKRDHITYDRSEAKTVEEKEEIYHQALSCDYYLMSSNAITKDGKLVNIDGRGNRIGALIYGPRNIIVVAGMNKIRRDEESALKRVREYAAPINAIRLEQQTPCTSSGLCHDCTANDCICCQVLVTRMSRVKGRIKVILIGEELGY